MPPKARPTEDVEKPAESNDAPPATATGDGKKTKPKADQPQSTTDDVDGAEEPPAEGDVETGAPKPGLYRFTWPYPCIYQLPDRTSKPVEAGEEIYWPDGAPDALWESVSDEPAPAPSDNTPRE